MPAGVSKDKAEAGAKQMSEKFKGAGEQVYVDAEKVKGAIGLFNKSQGVGGTGLVRGFPRFRNTRSRAKA